MTNTIIIAAIRAFASVILGSGVIERVKARVEVWANKAFPDIPDASQSALKRHGVMSDLEQIGVILSESMARLAVELAYQLFKREKA